MPTQLPETYVGYCPHSVAAILYVALNLTALLGGPWDLVTTYNWGYNPTHNWVTPISPFREIISRVISPVISSS